MNQDRTAPDRARTLVRLITTVRICAAFALGAALIAAAALPREAAPAQATATPVAHERHALLHADAVEAFLSHRYSAAFGRFALLADEGHVPSALAALMMARHGAELFGADWYATPEQLQRWSALANADLLANGAPVAARDRGE